MTPKMTIEHWRPTYRPKPKANDDGGTQQDRQEAHGIVSVFTYFGGHHGTAFTVLEMYLLGKMYRARFERAYHPRYFGHLAGSFDAQCWATAKRLGDVR